jgi:hypothetical protein
MRLAAVPVQLAVGRTQPAVAYRRCGIERPLEGDLLVGRVESPECREDAGISGR